MRLITLAAKARQFIEGMSCIEIIASCIMIMFGTDSSVHSAIEGVC